MIPGILQIEANHLVERRPAPASNLPQARDTWLDVGEPSAMPPFIASHFVWKGGTWPDERHGAKQHVPQLRQLVET